MVWNKNNRLLLIDVEKFVENKDFDGQVQLLFRNVSAESKYRRATHRDF